jgi:2-methylcitrate dehydratase PrpD
MPLRFIHEFELSSAPKTAQRQACLSLMDLLGIGAAARASDLSRIVYDHAEAEFMGKIPLPFAERSSSAQGMAMAFGMTVDALDGHDGFNPSKGHIGCSLIPAILAMAQETNARLPDIHAAILMGYEIGARLAIVQHDTCPDYHTSGSWGAVAAAAAAARLMRLSIEQTRHALGIAEYHGPRSQMMRCIDDPTMVKDGSGWGSMAGVSAAKLAKAGFTGAPAITLETDHPAWQDLGTRWYMLEQYYKPYPVCRWAQAPIEAVLHLRRTHDLRSEDIAQVHITSFHESIRLATNDPKTTEEAQYSTSFPTAIAMVFGDVPAKEVMDIKNTNPEVKRLSQSLTMGEDDHANAAFPLRRYARATLTLRDGRSLTSDWHEPRWDYTAPPSEEELIAKYNTLATPVLGQARAEMLRNTCLSMQERETSAFFEALNAPV